MKHHIRDFIHPGPGKFFLIAGPCVIEDEDTPFSIAEKIKATTGELQIPYIFKASYRKANRSSLSSFTGIGNIRALEIIQKVGKEFNIPTITDVHTAEEAKIAAAYVDILQIPAFLCRQTDLLVAAGATGKPVNIKKGQFLAPAAMKFAIEKVMGSGADLVMLTERGTSFGYHDLVVDMRSIPWMKELGVPVILDGTHSLQVPNRSSGTSGGHPQMIETITSAGIAAGADGLFLEVHPEPAKALSDSESMLKLESLPPLLKRLMSIKEAISK